MEIWQAAVLGLVQGLTEFLPVSSSGHLIFLQRLFGLDGGLFIPLVLHLGTLVAVCTVFFKDILALFKKPFKTLGFLALATIPAGLVGLFADDYIEDFISGGNYVGIFLSVFFLITASLLLVTETLVKKRARAGEGGCAGIGWRTVIPMGLAQAVAVLPGISRSGSTICAGALVNGRGEEIAKFSFLMSIPIILGGFAVDLAKGLWHGEIQATFAAGGTSFAVGVALGFVISAAVGLFAIKVMLKAVQKANYKWFSLYLAMLSVVCFVLNFTGHLGAI